MTLFRKKPVIIEAWQWPYESSRGVCDCEERPPHLHTVHARQIVLLENGDWIIPEPDGEHYYPCKPDIFEATYEPAPYEPAP